MTYPGGTQYGPPPGPPVSIERANRAHRWFRVYVAILVLMSLNMAVGAVLAMVFGVGSTEPVAADERIGGLVFAFVALAVGALHAFGLFLPRKPWAWVYGLVLIGLGMTTCITWPATVPLLIAWLKPGMKARFGAH